MMAYSRKTKITIYVVLLTSSFGLLFVACNNNEDFQGGKSNKIDVKKIESDTVDAELTYYYPDGKIKAIYHRKDSLMHGPFEEFYRNGKLDKEGKMYYGREKGTVAFYDSATGRLVKYINYIPIGNGDSSLVNEVIYFDENGKVDSNALNTYFQTAVPKDTIGIDEEFQFSIKITQPYFNTNEIVLCEFDEFYNLADSSTCGSSMMKNGEITLRRSENPVGRNVVRGVIISSEPNEKYKGNVKKPATTTYFEIPYFVKPE